MNKVVLGGLFVASIAAVAHAFLNLMVTIATNDFRDYQPVLKTALVCSLVSLSLGAVLALRTTKQWRFIAAPPIALSGLALWEIARRWSYTFGGP